MKNELSIKVIIWSFTVAIFIAVLITFYVGSFNESGFSESPTNFYWNTLLINLTFMGDAFFAFGIVFFLLFFLSKKYIALNFLIAILIVLTLTQAIKNIFSGLPLQLFFEEAVMQNANEVLMSRNIISSHASITFTIAAFFFMYSRKLFLKMGLVLLALIVALTRVTLAGDTLAALALGLIPTIVAMAYVQKAKHKKIHSNRAYFYKSRKERKIVLQRLLRV
jgi:hypothetical protein